MIFRQQERMFKAVHKFFIINHSRVLLTKPEMMTLDAQSFTATVIRPSWVPTSCALFKPLLLEVSTNQANSYNKETRVTLYTFLIKQRIDWDQTLCVLLLENSM